MTVKPRKPSDRVDVYWVPGKSPGLPEREGRKVKQAQLVTQNATVLEVVKKETGGTPEERWQAAAGGGDAVAMLKVREGEVQSVVTAIENGQVYLVKRR